MSSKSQVSDRNSIERFVRPVVISTVLGIAVCMLFLFLLSQVVALRSIPHTMIDPMAILAISAGAFAGGFSCGRMLRAGGLVFGAVCGGMLAFLVLTAGFSVGETGFGIPALFRVVFILLSSMLGGVLGVNAKGKRK